MAISKQQLEQAYQILRSFEKKDIPPNEFSWDYITERVGVNRSTLWRKDDFREAFERTKRLTKSYKARARAFDKELVEKTYQEQRIEKLEEEIDRLNLLLERERERLAYAQQVARKRGIDPLEFMDQSPLSSAIKKKYES